MKIGIDIGGSHIVVGLIDNYNIIVKKEKDILDEDKKDVEYFIVKTIVKYINEIIKENNISENDIEMIGIAAPGTIKDGVIIKATNLGLVNFDIISKLKEYFNIKCIIRNDAKCATLAEKYCGSMKDYNDFVYICLGTGIGCGVVINNKLIQPNRYEGFELGHMTIEKNGLQCTCGKKGCWEKYASMKALKNNLNEYFKYDISELLSLLKNSNNNEKTNEIIDNYITNLSIGIENIINIFEPEAICIGGSFVYYQEVLLGKLLTKLKQRNATFNNELLPDILCAKLENYAGVIGAIIE